MDKVSINHEAIYKMMHDQRGPVARDMKRRGRNVKALAKVKVPVDTGALKKSITSRMLEDNHSIYVEIGSELDYAVYVELGTRYNNGGQPFLRPALKAAGDDE